MCWAGILDGAILPMVSIDAGTSVNGEIYANVLQNIVWQPLRSKITRKQYWIQQDGAPCHCTSANLKFLESKFHERVISRRSSFPWPAHSPDLSPLNYWLWNQLEQEVFSKNQTISLNLKKLFRKLQQIFVKQTFAEQCATLREE